MGIQIGPVMIPWYGLFLVLGIFAGMALGYVLVRAFRLIYDDFIQIVCFVGLGAMAGSKLLYLIVSWKSIDFSRLTDPEYFNALMSGGFVFYGGLLGGLLGLYLCGKILHIAVSDYARLLIPVIPLAHAFGRIGCALAGCCYGVPYDGPGAVVYAESLAAPNGMPLFPVQALEASLNLITATVLCVYILHSRKRAERETAQKVPEKAPEKTRVRDGETDGWQKRLRSVELYLLFYASERFVLEFFRYDDSERGILYGLSTSQWISIAVILAAAGRVLHLAKREKREVNTKVL